MNDDPWSKFTGRHTGKSPAAAPRPALVVDHEPQGPQAYEAFYAAFENQVRTENVEIRCHSSGLSYFFEYTQITVPVFNFRTGGEIMFTGGGYAVTIKGRNLGHIIRALRLKSCTTIQDFNSGAHIMPEPIDPDASFVESITVEALRAPKHSEAREPEAEKA
jgi:hypothetical protein